MCNPAADSCQQLIKAKFKISDCFNIEESWPRVPFRLWMNLLNFGGQLPDWPLTTPGRKRTHDSRNISLCNSPGRFAYMVEFGLRVTYFPHIPVVSGEWAA
jgi:hypothetical protein